MGRQAKNDEDSKMKGRAQEKNRRGKKEIEMDD
jgi:hypothetical protein